MANMLIGMFLFAIIIFFTITNTTIHKPLSSLSLIFLGVSLLVGIWFVLYWFELLFTESHLVGYYCCLTSRELPLLGTPARTMTEFFKTPLGQHAFPAFFVSVSVGITAYRLHQQKLWLETIRSVLGISLIYLILEILLVGIGWSLSTWIFGPQQTAYSGLERRMGGIILHLGLWITFFWAILRWQYPSWISQLPLHKR